MKFVPASGAASRMFKNMFAFVDADYDVPTTDFEKKYFDPNICKIQVIYDSVGFEQSIKYAIHKFGCLLLACDITEEWYLCGPKKTAITGKSNNRSVGGHAILCCGYNRDGVIIHNSWGEEWGAYGYALITWEALRKQFLYAAVLTNCLNNLKLN